MTDEEQNNLWAYIIFKYLESISPQNKDCVKRQLMDGLKKVKNKEKKDMSNDEKTAYMQGAHDASEYYKMVVCGSGLTRGQLNEIFGTFLISDILENYDFDEIKTKIDKYNDRTSIHVGDVVTFRATHCREYVVTSVYDNLAVLLAPTGRYYTADTSKLEKTGRMYDIKKMLGALKTSE